MKDIINKSIRIDFDIWNLLKEWGGWGYGCGYKYGDEYGDGYGNGESRIKLYRDGNGDGRSRMG
jgi:hypothetical protein